MVKLDPCIFLGLCLQALENLAREKRFWPIVGLFRPDYMTCIKSKKAKTKKIQNKKKTLLRWRMWWHTSIRFSIQELPQGTFILKSKDSTILERNWFSSGLAGLESCVIFNLHVNVTVWGEGLRERSRRASYIFSFWQFLPYYISSPLILKNVLFDKAYSS